MIIRAQTTQFWVSYHTFLNVCVYPLAKASLAEARSGLKPLSGVFAKVQVMSGDPASPSSPPELVVSFVPVPLAPAWTPRLLSLAEFRGLQCTGHHWRQQSCWRWAPYDIIEVKYDIRNIIWYHTYNTISHIIRYYKLPIWYQSRYLRIRQTASFNDFSIKAGILLQGNGSHVS